MGEHQQAVFELEKDDKVTLEFSNHDTVEATVISPYETLPHEQVLFDVDGYDNVLEVATDGRGSHKRAITRSPGLVDFGYVTNVKD